MAKVFREVGRVMAKFAADVHLFNKHWNTRRHTLLYDTPHVIKSVCAGFAGAVVMPDNYTMRGREALEFARIATDFTGWVWHHDTRFLCTPARPAVHFQQTTPTESGATLSTRSRHLPHRGAV